MPSVKTLPGSEGPADTAAPSFSPLYQQIKGLLTRSLGSGEWKAGEALPAETELAQRFKVSQGTVRKALDALTADGLLVRRQGKGTFVATHAEAQVQYRFLRLMPDHGLRQAMQRRFLDFRRLRAPADIARALDLKAGDGVLQLRRLLLSGDSPVVLDDIWLNARLFKGLTAERLQAYRGPMYGLFEAEFGVQMIRAEEKIRAVAAGAAEAALLGAAAQSPLLLVERRSFTYADRPVELRRGLYRTEAHYYRNELS
ncbi:MAG: GntR family transcriptional regulator [Burkholderiaceae bacterium]|jgi:GntR family transcriptional regulator|nr:GntR family transcriptional regulator [Burkholderiaceae bacterium]